MQNAIDAGTIEDLIEEEDVDANHISLEGTNDSNNVLHFA